MARDIIAFDFDGTLVDLDGIAHLWGDWDAFHFASFDCPPREAVVEFARRCQSVSEVVVITGKPMKYHFKLTNWLSMQGLLPDKLLMRPDSSTMSDVELKPALMTDWLGPEWQSRIIAIIEDRDKMVDAWRAEGVLCLQAAPCIETRLKKGLLNAEAAGS